MPSAPAQYLAGERSEPTKGVQSRTRIIYVVGMSEYVCRMSN